MFSVFINILFVTLFVGAFGDPNQIIIPCQMNDEVCMTKSAKVALPLILSGIPELNVASSDPLQQDEITGDLSILKFKFTNSIVTGFKNCDINNVKLDLQLQKLNFNLTCENIAMEGDYTISGRLIILPVEGEGKYRIEIKKYEIGLSTEIKQFQDSKGVNHMKIKNYKIYSEAKDGVVYNFENLFNGQKDLADAVLKFANENWKEVADFVQEPVVSKNIKDIISNVNKYLKTVPMNDMFLN